jgi:Spy/CpxP family protein refolding chaperone
MKRGLVAAAALTLLVASIGMASAQGGGGRGQGRGFGGRGGMFGGGLGMLRIKEVQEELKMTQAQTDKVEGKQQEVQQAMRDLFQNAGGFQNMSQEERQKLMAKTQEIQTKAVNDILDAKQQKRFHQLELQQMGASAFTRPEVAKELNLTDDQKSKIREIQQAQQEKVREIFQNAGQGGDRQAMMEQMQTLQKAANEKITAVLTDAQKAQWKTMQGDAFKFPAPQPRQPRQQP